MPVAVEDSTREHVQSASFCHALAKIDELCTDPLMRAKLRGLMRAYHARWQHQQIAVLEIEQTITSDLYNPATSAKSRSFIMAGKKDILLEESGKYWLMDHKTSSEDIADPDAAYWRQLAVEGQHYHYALLEHLNGKRIEGAIWDVVHKPSISPRQIAKADQALMSSTNLYFGATVTRDDVAEVRETGRENFKLYESRLAWDATRIRPEWYFQRFRVARLDHELLEYASELWIHTQDILLCRRENRWPRNSGACMNYGRACKFLGICSGHDTPDSQNWKAKEWVHAELPILNGDAGKNVLTNSRVRCFQTCRRKHFYQYELGIDRVEQEEVETLLFGTLWHEAQAIYFEAWKTAAQKAAAQ
jgi:hypothetical protein